MNTLKYISYTYCMLFYHIYKKIYLYDIKLKDYESKLAGQQIDHYDTINFDFDEELKKLNL